MQSSGKIVSLRKLLPGKGARLSEEDSYYKGSPRNYTVAKELPHGGYSLTELSPYRVPGRELTREEEVGLVGLLKPPILSIPTCVLPGPLLASVREEEERRAGNNLLLSLMGLLGAGGYLVGGAAAVALGCGVSPLLLCLLLAGWSVTSFLRAGARLDEPEDK